MGGVFGLTLERIMMTMKLLRNFKTIDIKHFNVSHLGMHWSNIGNDKNVVTV
jgi:hypothetical protein